MPSRAAQAQTVTLTALPWLHRLALHPWAGGIIITITLTLPPPSTLPTPTSILSILLLHKTVQCQRLPYQLCPLKHLIRLIQDPHPTDRHACLTGLPIFTIIIPLIILPIILIILCLRMANLNTRALPIQVQTLTITAWETHRLLYSSTYI